MVNKERLINEFLDEIRIESFSGEERLFAERLAGILESLGMAVDMDSANEVLGGDCGNLICTLKGSLPEVPTIFLSAHMDTIVRAEGVNPVIRNGVIYTDGTTILGADDKVAIAAIIEAIRVLTEQEPPHGDIQLLFTVMEERGLLGAQHLDYSKVSAQFGFNMDSRGDLGLIRNHGPYEDKFTITVRGKAAHFTAAPQSGIDAIRMAARAIARMKLGQINEDTSANIGIIKGGEVTNVIPALVEMWGEVRTQREERELKKQEDHMRLVLDEAAREFGGQAEFEVWRVYDGFELTEEDTVVQIAMAAWRRLGIEPGLIPSRGGGDVNIFVGHGLPCVTPNCGYYESASVDEHVPIENLVTLTRYILALIAETATHFSGSGKAVRKAWKWI
jgi:tripeptide aminopeptidase